jgi:hypothetical protein
VNRPAAPAALAALAFAAACGGVEAPDGDAPVRAAISAYDAAWLAKDSARVAGILAPGYLYYTSNGGISERERSLSFLADTSYHLEKSVRTDVRLDQDGPVVRVTSRWEGKGWYQGKPVLDDQTCGQIWIWKDARWRLYSEHCVNRPPVQ